MHKFLFKIKEKTIKFGFKKCENFRWYDPTLTYIYALL